MKYKKIISIMYVVTFCGLAFSHYTKQTQNQLSNYVVEDKKIFNINQTSWNSHESIKSELDVLNNVFPNLIKNEISGYSEENNPIYQVTLSNFDNKKSKPVGMIIGGLHGNEPMGTEVGISLVKFILSAYGSNKEITRLLNDYTIVMVPLANPDARIQFQRTNANGIDINRDFEKDKCLSQECQVLKNVSISFKPIWTIDLHESGDYVEIPFYNFSNYRDKKYTYNLAKNITKKQTYFYVNTGTESKKGMVTEWQNDSFGTIPLIIEFGKTKSTQFSSQSIKKYVISFLPLFMKFIDQIESDLVQFQVLDSKTNQLVDGKFYFHQAQYKKSWPSTVEKSYYKLLSNGFYKITVSAPGYKDVSVPFIKYPFQSKKVTISL